MAVRKEKDKNTWYVQTSFVNYMGERKRTTKRGFRTKRDALEWEEEFKRSNSGCKDMTLNSLYERYKEELKDLPIQMNPIMEGCSPNYWLSAMIIDKDAMCRQVRGEQDVCYIKTPGKTCPTEILEAITSINAEGRPIWKPMHMQPMYRMHEFITVAGSGRARTNAYIAGGVEDIGADIFQRGVCLPSDNKMTKQQQLDIIQVIKDCFA